MDVGTSKIVVIVSELQSDGVLKIIGLGQHISKGLKKGVKKLSKLGSKTAVEEAELMADCKIKDVYTGIAGSHIQSLNSHGMVTVKTLRFHRWMLTGLLKPLRQYHLPPDQQVFHILLKNMLLINNMT